MLALLILSVGLAMDAFAVSLVRGTVGERRFVRAAELGFAFGLAQGLMPLVGWGLGTAFKGTFQTVDHWIAFGLLSILGARMLTAAAKLDGTAVVKAQTRLLGLLTAAFATSIDAAAAGLTFSILDVSVPIACLTIGAATAILCTAGYLLGSIVSQRAGNGGGGRWARPDWAWSKNPLRAPRLTTAALRGLQKIGFKTLSASTDS